MKLRDIVKSTGEHGWYWVNYNDFPVVISLTVTGFYDDVVD